MTEPPSKTAPTTQASINRTRVRERFMRLPEVSRMTGLPRSTMYRLIKAKLFPSPIPLLGTKVVVWLETDVQTYIDAQIAAHNRSEPL